MGEDDYFTPDIFLYLFIELIELLFSAKTRVRFVVTLFQRIGHNKN